MKERGVEKSSRGEKEVRKKEKEGRGGAGKREGEEKESS